MFQALYELFAQVLSAQPGAVLCRIDSPCDLIVSLRSLSTRSETVIISIDADDEQWSINEKQKCKSIDYNFFITAYFL